MKLSLVDYNKINQNNVKLSEVEQRYAKKNDEEENNGNIDYHRWKDTSINKFAY